MRPQAFALALASFTIAASARAEPLAARLVRLLDTPGRLHPMGDRINRVPITVPLPAGVSARSLGLLQVAPGIGAARLAPDEVAAFTKAHPDLFLSAMPPLRPQLDVSNKWTNVGNFRTVTGLNGSGAAVGIVDTGIDVTHADFRDESGKTRIAWLLTGGKPLGLHKDLEEALGCYDPQQSSCAVYAREDIDAMLEAGAVDVHDVEGHGTHVASIAAGNGGPTATKAPRFIGVAPGATLIVAAPGGAEGFFDADILRATAFVMDRADAMGLPVAVNLSLGSDYGSHDGLSPLEVGLSAMVGEDKPGKAIVVAAGNSGTLYDLGDGKGPYGIHTEVHVSPHETTRVPIEAGAAKSGEVFVWVTFRPGDDVEVGLEGPKGATWVGLTGRGDEAGYASGSGADAVKAGVVNNLPKSNAAMSPDTNSAAVVWTGAWPDAEFAVVLRGKGDASLWLTGTGDAIGTAFFSRAIRQGTINVPASAPGLLAVGCTINRIAWDPLSGHGIELSALGGDDDPKPDGACYFSAEGPTPFGVQKPEISAPGGFVGAAMSDDADPRTHAGGLFVLDGCPPDDPNCAVLDDRHALATGTSMSTPHVTGAIALLFGLDPTLTQGRVTTLLQAGARQPTGHVPDPQQLGPGAMDLQGARIALTDTDPTPIDADPGKSWYTLGASYARPDPTWPVWGTVSLRKSDGRVAGGLDGSKLSLSVTGGEVFQALTRVAPGMYRFAVAGRLGDVGGSVRVEVSYAGASLGVTALPVGSDRWASADTALGAASGACQSGVGGAGGAGAAAFGAAAAALVSRRRRRRRCRGNRSPGG